MINQFSRIPRMPFCFICKYENAKYFAKNFLIHKLHFVCNHILHLVANTRKCHQQTLYKLTTARSVQFAISKSETASTSIIFSVIAIFSLEVAVTIMVK